MSKYEINDESDQKKPYHKPRDGSAKGAADSESGDNAKPKSAKDIVGLEGTVLRETNTRLKTLIDQLNDAFAGGNNLPSSTVLQVLRKCIEELLLVGRALTDDFSSSESESEVKKLKAKQKLRAKQIRVNRQKRRKVASA